MSAQNAGPGSGREPAGRPDQGPPAAGATGEANLTGAPDPAGGWLAPPPPPPPSPPPGAPGPPGPAGPAARRRRGRRSRARLWAALGGGAVLVVALVVIAATVLTGGGGTGVPAGTPDGAQLEQLLPAAGTLPPGWYLSDAPAEPTAFFQPGHRPPEPIDACLDFNQGFDLGVAGDTSLSTASETALFGAGAGDGLLRTDLFGVMPGDAAAAIRAVGAWAARCSSYTVVSHYFRIRYTVTAGPVPGLGDQSLDVRVTMHRPHQLGGNLLPLIGNNTLLVRVGNDLIAIECLAPPDSMIASLAGLAAPMAKRLPSAATLPTSGPAARPPVPKPAPAASPDLPAADLNRLLPVSSGLPAEFYQGSPATPVDWTNPGNVPLTRPPTALTCAQLLTLPAGTELNHYDVNYRIAADLSEYDPNSNGLDVEIDEDTTAAMASADVAALRAAAARCPTLSHTEIGDTNVYRARVTSVPGLGAQNVNVHLDPVSSSPGFALSGPEDILLVRVGAAVVMVDYALSLPEQVPPVAAIARRIVAKL
jgi:hypothetical protein